MTTDPPRSAPGLPPHVRAAVDHPRVVEALRDALARTECAVVVLPVAAMPETLGAVVAVEGVAHVAAVSLDAARELATIRARAAAVQLGETPPVGRGWVLVLCEGQRVAVLARPRGERVEAPAPNSDPRVTSRGGRA